MVQTKRQKAAAAAAAAAAQAPPPAAPAGGRGKRKRNQPAGATAVDPAQTLLDAPTTASPELQQQAAGEGPVADLATLQSEIARLKIIMLPLVEEHASGASAGAARTQAAALLERIAEQRAELDETLARVTVDSAFCQAPSDAAVEAPGHRGAQALPAASRPRGDAAAQLRAR